MARSKYVYIIFHEWSAKNPLIAAFTVKHELLTWLEKCNHEHKEEFIVYRIPDNDYTELYETNCKQLRRAKCDIVDIKA